MKIHGFDAASSEIGVSPIIGVLVSFATCAIASADGTPDVPMITSHFSSWISLRALRPAALGSEPSSSTTSWILRPPISPL